ATAKVGISLQGIEGPGAYGLNRNVTLTILVAKNNIVTANFALVQPSLPGDAERVLREVVKLIGGKVPAASELMPPGAMSSRVTGAPDDNLRPLLRPALARDAKPEEVDRAAKAVEAYLKDHAVARVQLGRAARTIIASGKLADYGTPQAHSYLKT